jgi:hypothetical protein
VAFLTLRRGERSYQGRCCIANPARAPLMAHWSGSTTVARPIHD